MSIYFDNSATTKPLPEVARLVFDSLSDEHGYGNPSSLHRLGVIAESSWNDAMNTIARCLGCQPSELILTSCGSESVETAILGSVPNPARTGMKIISTKTEHRASLRSLDVLASRGYEIIYLPVNQEGAPDLTYLERILDEKVALLTFTYVNNETGAILPLQDIVRLRNKCAPQAKIHIDAVQALGKMPISVKKLGVDMMSFSGHKIHAVKGVGLLYVEANTMKKLRPLIMGGGQQNDKRSGTMAPYLANAFALALEMANDGIDENLERIHILSNTFRYGLTEMGAQVLSPLDALPYVLNVSFPGFQSETMLHCLEENEIYVSTVSACSSKKKQISYVLTEMGYSQTIAENAIRFSFSRFTTEQEIEEALSQIAKIYSQYRLF